MKTWQICENPSHELKKTQNGAVIKAEGARSSLVNDENVQVFDQQKTKTKSIDCTDNNLEQSWRPCELDISGQDYGFQWRRFNDGPWRPNHPKAPHDPGLTKCQMCSWHFKLNKEPQCHKCT